jgi:O-antigen/teichoic acid export membrane protein
MTRHQKVLMAATTGSALVGVAASFALVPGYGILGAAAATATAIVLMNAITLLSVRRLLNFWPYDRRYAKPIAAGALAAAAVYLLMVATPVPQGIRALLFFAPLFLVFYASLLAALGLGKSDRQLLAALWAPARRGARRIARLWAGAGRV